MMKKLMIVFAITSITLIIGCKQEEWSQEITPEGCVKTYHMKDNHTDIKIQEVVPVENCKGEDLPSVPYLI